MERASWLWARVRALDGRRLGLLAEAFFALVAARIALRLVPVRFILAWQARPVRGMAGESNEKAERARQMVAWALEVLARRSPVAFVCFPRCLAGSLLLRARGVASRLHYGVNRQGGRLVTHTWLESGGEVLIGGDVKDGYSTLGVY